MSTSILFLVYCIFQ